MSLIKCYECAKQISSEAHACPHCGAPRKLTEEEELMEIVANYSTSIIPSCPHCGSTHFEKLAGPLHKLASGGSLFSNQQYRCHSCRHLW